MSYTASTFSESLGKYACYENWCLFREASLTASQSHLCRERLKRTGTFLGSLGMRKVQVLEIRCLPISDIKEEKTKALYRYHFPQEEFYCCFLNSVRKKKIQLLSGLFYS